MHCTEVHILKLHCTALNWIALVVLYLPLLVVWFGYAGSGDIPLIPRPPISHSCLPAVLWHTVTLWHRAQIGFLVKGASKSQWLELLARTPRKSSSSKNQYSVFFYPNL